ncbi:hypothetical protein M569_14698 [Genlisea aurea]|uniref:HTH myb-type domain-containing protein n=1 Tax=Genlisea aurea TaxID=192259 RepID=S8C6R3_9LAMI|nr:hypothetical protein M569_14698 [Genlisea aurea]
MMPSPAADLFPLHEKLSESRVRYKGGEDKVPLLSLSTVETKDLKEEMINNYSSGLSSTSRSMASSPAADSKLNSKKRRRCWSPDLHRKFVSVLQQLGGAQVATPKQIRELMQVDGLTNDEVKSHLQKYRVHVRRTDKVSVAKSRGERPCKTSKNGNSPTGSLELARSMTEDYEEEEEEEDVSEINNQ